MDRQDLINTCVFEQFQGLLFSDLSGPLNNKGFLSHTGKICQTFNEIPPSNKIIMS